MQPEGTHPGTCVAVHHAALHTSSKRCVRASNLHVVHPAATQQTLLNKPCNANIRSFAESPSMPKQPAQALQIASSLTLQEAASQFWTTAKMQQRQRQMQRMLQQRQKLHESLYHRQTHLLLQQTAQRTKRV